MTAPLSELEVLTIERACERLVLDFGDCSDRQDYEALTGLFAEDCVMHRPNGELLTGRAAILKSYQSRAAGHITRHVCTNIRVTVESRDRASGMTYALVYSANASEPPERHFGIKANERHLIGEFEDEFARTPEGWRIASRLARFVMHAG